MSQEKLNEKSNEELNEETTKNFGEYAVDSTFDDILEIIDDALEDVCVPSLSSCTF